MPHPITPMHQQGNHDGLFDLEADLNYQGISSLQSLFLGGGTEKTAAKKFSESTTNLLDAIYKNEDDVLSFANSLGTKTANTSDDEKRVFRTPQSISDYELLSLKTQGLVAGQGRAVTFTQLGRQALRDNWLVRPNALRNNRKKSTFDLEAERRAEESKPKTVRIASAVQKSKVERLPDIAAMEALAGFQLNVKKISAAAKNARVSTAGFYEAVDIACDFATEGNLTKANEALSYIAGKLNLRKVDIDSNE